jgi:hypothetical protein
MLLPMFYGRKLFFAGKKFLFFVDRDGVGEKLDFR